MPKKIKKEYLVIGSNNFWYGTHSSKKDALSEAKHILKGPSDYSDPESGNTPDIPETVYIYEANEIVQICVFKKDML